MGDWLAVVPFAIIVMLAASTGAIFEPGDWYERLDKPSWTPPNWMFPIVWTILYIMIAAAGYLVWQAERFGPALAVWGINLALNAAWSWVMFGRRKIRLAFYDALAMLVTTGAFVALAWPVSPVAALLFVPYLVWVATAVLLNYRILQLNPGTVRA